MPASTPHAAVTRVVWPSTFAASLVDDVRRLPKFLTTASPTAEWVAPVAQAHARTPELAVRSNVDEPRDLAKSVTVE